MTIKNRKKFTMDVIDKETLRYFYEDQLMSPRKIGEKFNKTRVRIWQLLKKYGLHNGRRVVRVCVKCKEPFKVVRIKVRTFPSEYCTDGCYYDHCQEVSGQNPSKVGQERARKVIEEWLGFKLPDAFVVHHEDENELNNEPGNLFVFPSQSEHMKYHHAKRDGNAELPYKKMYELYGKIEEWLMV